MVSEHATAAEGLAVWKVGASQAVVAVVTVLGSEFNTYVPVSRVALLTIGRCMRLVGVHHSLFLLEEVCIHSEEVAR